MILLENKQDERQGAFDSVGESIELDAQALLSQLLETYHMQADYFDLLAKIQQGSKGVEKIGKT